MNTLLQPRTGCVTSEASLSRYREASYELSPRFRQKGHLERNFFPHRIYFLPKAGPDGLRMAAYFHGLRNPEKCWQLVLFAHPSVTEQFPEKLFFDDEILWHQQQLGRKGQIADATLVVHNGNVYGSSYWSDIVQRISRRREFKTQIEKKFQGWIYLLLNAIGNFALEMGAKNFLSPSSDLARKFTDPNRTVERELFDRIYDRAVTKLFSAERQGDWWVINIERNRERVVPLEKKEDFIKYGKTICICHDIERSLGHRKNTFLSFSSPEALESMLRIEEAFSVRATYHIVACLFNDVAEKIRKAGHCLGFHSYDHTISMFLPWLRLQHLYPRWFPLGKRLIRHFGGSTQPGKCRLVDYRLKGYRPPQSKLSIETSDSNLVFHNYEWLASSSRSLKVTRPVLSRRLVKVPIAMDDFALFQKKISFQDWEKKALDLIASNNFVALSFHDCYGNFWLPHYPTFLEKIKRLGELRTLDQVANTVILANAI